MRVQRQKLLAEPERSKPDQERQEPGHYQQGQVAGLGSGHHQQGGQGQGEGGEKGAGDGWHRADEDGQEGGGGRGRGGE